MEQMDQGVLEAELASLPEVRAARVVTTPNGRISEIHIVSEGTKSPKQLVRDVQTVAQARFGLQIDHRIVSVVRFPDEPSPAAKARYTLSSLSWSTEGTKATCRVRIEIGDETVLGESSGPASSVGRARLTAEATTNALSQVAKDPPVADVGDVRVVDVGAQRVAVAVVVLLLGAGEEVVVTGSAPVRGDESEAIARAILDAVARHTGA
jgi:hypothetical protein